MGQFAVGQSVLRTEDPRLLRGWGRYIADVAHPGMVHARVVRSPHAHALIRGVNVDEARAAPGVLLVLTGADWKASGCNDLATATGKTRRDGRPMYRPRYPALAADRVRFVGDPVAFVVAETLAEAEEAAELVAVDYEPLPAITDTATACEPGAPLVWDDCPQNICMVHIEGDRERTDAAFAAADHVVAQRFVISRVTAASLETRGAVGIYDAGADRYTIHTPVQRGHNYRRELAEALRIPESRLRVLSGDIGGSFGMKSGLYNEAPLVLLAAKRLGRPVKWVASRSEAFLSDTHGRDNVTDAELALDGAGRFLALRVRTVGNVGAYTQPGSDVGVHGNVGSLAGVYVTPAIHVDATAVYTNTNPIRPYRGNGRPEAAYVIERMVDLAADALGLDPVEIRRRNMIPEAAMPFQTALSFLYDCGAFERVLDAALRRADYDGFPIRREEARARGRLRGIGLSCTIERAGIPGAESAEIRVDPNGSVVLITGAIDQGQGHGTAFKQIVCERLGVTPDAVQYVQGDTDALAHGEGTYGSRTSSIGASAVALAVRNVIEKGARIAGHIMGVDNAEFRDGVYASPGTNRTMTLGEVAAAALLPQNLPEDVDAGLSATAGYSTTRQNYPNGAHAVEVEIDPDTGVVTIERYAVADDVGTVLNPMLVKGQMLGGIAQGVGQILMELIRFEPESGQNQTGSFMDYAMPRASLLPRIAIDSIPVPTETNPLGAKGAGEGGCVGAMPALANAIVNALSVYGIKHVDMPATPETVWRLIVAAKSGRVSTAIASAAGEVR